MRVGRIIAEPLVINERLPGRTVRARVAELLRHVGLDPSYADRFPHEFSGGQRQRIAIARSLVVRPRLIVLDEPVSALDVSIRAQILNLLKDLQQEYGLSYFLISHNLATMRYISDTIGIMYLGRLVETAPSEAFFTKPLHPYSQALLAATLPVDPDTRGRRLVVPGEVPSPLNPPSGCRFRTRCPFVMPVCAEVDPVLAEVAPDHRVACHLYGAPAKQG
jgi:oligopeptide/dipeptide ABC transporter ATP-binding protein